MIPFRLFYPAILLLLALIPVSCRESVSSSEPSGVPSDLVTVDVWLEIDAALAVSGALPLHFVSADSSGASYVVIFEHIDQEHYRTTLPLYVAQGGGQLVVSVAGKSYFLPLNSQTWLSGQTYLYSLVLTPDGFSFRLPDIPGPSDGWDDHYQTDVVLE